MDSMPILFFLILIFPTSVVLQANSQTEPNPQAECLKKLLPCEPYLHSSNPPPGTCCEPMKEMIGNETQCLCGVITNPAILKSFNITQGDALNLAKSCGANADLSICKSNAGPPTSSPTPPASNSSSTDNSTTDDSVKKGAAIGVLPCGNAIFVVSLVGLLVLSL